MSQSDYVGHFAIFLHNLFIIINEVGAPNYRQYVQNCGQKKYILNVMVTLVNGLKTSSPVASSRFVVEGESSYADSVITGVGLPQGLGPTLFLV